MDSSRLVTKNPSARNAVVRVSTFAVPRLDRNPPPPPPMPRPPPSDFCSSTTPIMASTIIRRITITPVCTSVSSLETPSPLATPNVTGAASAPREAANFRHIGSPRLITRSKRLFPAGVSPQCRCDIAAVDGGDIRGGLERQRLGKEGLCHVRRRHLATEQVAAHVFRLR